MYVPRLLPREVRTHLDLTDSLVTLDLLRGRLRLTPSGIPDDDTLTSVLSQAVMHVEDALGLALAESRWTATFRGFPAAGHAVPLIVSGLNAREATVAYTPEGGASTALDVVSVPRHVKRKDLMLYPTAAADGFPSDVAAWSVVVTYKRGVERVAEMPHDLVGAIASEVERIWNGLLEPDDEFGRMIQPYRDI